MGGTLLAEPTGELLTAADDPGTDGTDRDGEAQRDLAVGEAFDVEQKECSTLGDGQAIKSTEQLGVGQALIGGRLRARDLVPRRGALAVLGCTVRCSLLLSAPVADDVASDAQDPGADGSSFCQAFATLDGSSEDLLSAVLHVRIQQSASEHAGD